MKLMQLRYRAAIVQENLNVTAAARKSRTAQPGVSQQLRLLQDEFGFSSFEQEGYNLVGVFAIATSNAELLAD